MCESPVAEAGGAGPVSTRLPLDGVRVCFLRSHDYFSDSRVRKQASTLAEAGAQVTIVGVGDRVADDLLGREWDTLLLPPVYPDSRRNVPRLGREDVWWPLRVAVNLTYTKARTRWNRRSAPINKNEPLLHAAALELKPDIIHAYDVYTLPAAVRVKQATGARVVYDVRDLYMDVDYVEEPRKQRLKAAEAKRIRSADAVVTVSETLADVLQSRHDIDRPVVVYNGPIEVMTSAEPVHEPVRLFFQGVFAEHRNLAALIESMSGFRGRATLTLQGFGGVERDLRKQVAESRLEDVVYFIPAVKPRDVVVSAAEHDVGVICHKGTNVNMRSAVPNKLMDYLGAGLAIAASDLPGHRGVLEGTGAAAFIDPYSAASIAEGLSGLLDDPNRITAMKQAALATAKGYAWPEQAKSLLEVYESVTQLR